MRARTQRLRFPLPARYDVDWVLGFLARRALPGIERVTTDTYERRVGHDQIRIHWGVNAVTVTAPAGWARDDVAQRARRLLDLDADSALIDAHLSGGRRHFGDEGPINADMAQRVSARPGLRVPGAWDSFELIVRAILGQQVSVDRATQLARAMVERYGVEIAPGVRDFPSPERLAGENPSEIGMPRRRGEAIRRVAAAVAEGVLPRGPGNAQVLRAGLAAIPGVGPWTIEYVAMRAGRDADGFPETDWVVLRELDTTPSGARRQAEAWRPYRAYAVMYLWAASARRKEIR